MKKKLFAICVVSIVLIAVLVPSCAPTEDQMGMEDAIDVVVEDILPNIPEIQEGDPYWCLKLDSALPEGTVIEEDSGDTLRITLDEEKFFFYLDLAPGAYYEHDVKYILVDRNGNHEEYDARWWPLIGGEVPEELVSEVPDERDMIATNVEIEAHEPEQMLFDFPVLRLVGCEGFIVVQGLVQGEKLYDYAVDDHNNRYNFFTEYAAEHTSDCSQVVGLAQSNALNVFDTIDDMVDDGLNPITISIIAHGSVDSVSLGNQTVKVDQFCNKIAAHPYTNFNLIITSCHSGSFIDDLSTLDNVYVVATACRADETAYRDVDVWHWLFGGDDYIDYNPEDTGAEWTSSLLEAMSEIVQNEAKFEAITSLAEGYGVPETSVLIWMGSLGALGDNPSFDLLQDLDLCHRATFEHPQIYASWYLIE